MTVSYHGSCFTQMYMSGGASFLSPPPQKKRPGCVSTAALSSSLSVNEEEKFTRCHILNHEREIQVCKNLS